jgi:hypothetical protein
MNAPLTNVVDPVPIRSGFFLGLELTSTFSQEKRQHRQVFTCPISFLVTNITVLPQKALKALQLSRYIIVLLGLVFEGSIPELDPIPERFERSDPE